MRGAPRASLAADARGRPRLAAARRRAGTREGKNGLTGSTATTSPFAVSTIAEPISSRPTTGAHPSDSRVRCDRASVAATAPRAWASRASSVSMGRAFARRSATTSANGT